MRTTLNIDEALLGRATQLSGLREKTAVVRAGLEALVARPDRGAIYVIGSGENQEDGRRLMRGFGISEALRLPDFRPIYRGRDGLTQVWKADAPRSAARAQDR